MVAKGVGMAMVPLTAATLLTVAAAALPQAGGDLPRALTVVPFYVVFLVVMPLAGLLVTRLFRLGGRDGRAILFSGRPVIPWSCCRWRSPCPRTPRSSRW